MVQKEKVLFLWESWHFNDGAIRTRGKINVTNLSRNQTLCYMFRLSLQQSQRAKRLCFRRFKRKTDRVVSSASINQADVSTCWRSHHFLVIHWWHAVVSVAGNNCGIFPGRDTFEFDQEHVTKSQPITELFGWVKVHVYNNMKYRSDRFPQKAPLTKSNENVR